VFCGRQRLLVSGIAGAFAVTTLAAVAMSSGPVAQIPAGTHVRFHLTAPLSSNESKTGQHFDFVLLEPIAVDGTVVAPVGDEGEGTVLLAGHAGMKGHEGDLTLRLDFVEDPDGGDVVFENQHFEVNGVNEKAASALAGFIPFVGFFAQFIRGQDEHLGVNREIETVLMHPATVLPAPQQPSCVAALPTSSAEPTMQPMEPSPSSGTEAVSAPCASATPFPFMTPYGYTYPSSSPLTSASASASPSPSALPTP